LEDPGGSLVLATLRTKDSELTITGQGGSVRYSLVDAAGARHDNLTLEELLAYDEDLYEVVQFALAQNAGRAGSPFLDARVGPSPVGSVSSASPGGSVGSVVKALTANPAPAR
jgi:hypothetical protein